MDVLRPTVGMKHLIRRAFLRGVAGVSLASILSTAAVAQQPAGRAAALLPPRATEPAAPLVARGAVDDDPTAPLGSSPVVRPARAVKLPAVPPTAGPAWLNGVDPNLQPAGASSPPPRPRPVATVPPDPAPSLVTRGYNTLKGYVTSDRPVGTPAAAPVGMPPMGAMPPAPQPPAVPVADPNAPLQATGPNGAQMLAGPPAWRWYGYGSVTPGANTYAPAGQYPKASANWYSVTKATPGAFPVPVMNPYRPTPGGEPPSYLAAAPARVPAADVRPVEPFTPAPPPALLATPPAARFNPTPPPAPVSAQLPPVTPPRPAPAAVSALPLPPVTPPVGVPALVAPPVIGPVAVAPPAPEKVETKPESVAVAVPGVEPAAPPMPPASMGLSLARSAFDGLKPTVPVSVPTPATLPLTVTVPAKAPADDVKWQTGPDKPEPPGPGTWVPATGVPNKPGRAADGSWQPGATDTARPPVARGQANDPPQPDPVATLIRAVCGARANGVEVRWTGSKKVMVCFEVRSAPDAAAVVRDVTRRPELAPYQIDFCVLVK